ncbi:hypothetical protein NDI76_04330 [Halogeometricum sp. S1BR25-6]|uniref:Uncharacterized protein n=1 Tax=Halogeometricum salsisoli TaxID=2950536 RepID=A0ABU2GAY9_9EURY|nr:hypothetical protein [Halogeometricum sp. S1BR25-6]MDS0297960.1 hypothetical protein [Halogeometricum sp. S1BR25-6]
MVVNAAVDAAVFFLLLGAAVLGVTAADVGTSADAVDEGADRPDAVAAVLATSTATVNYSLAPGARRANGFEKGVRFERTAGPEFERTTRGSFAGLLARVAVGTAGFDGAPVTNARDGLRAAVRGAVRSELSTVGLRIDAVWRPYPDAPVEGRVAVGGAPPEGEAVDAATLTVPTGAEPLSPRETRDFASLSDAVANRTVDVLAPAGRMRLALRDDAPVSTFARYRYARLAAELGVSATDTADAVGDADTRTANRRFASTLAPRVESDLRGRYDSPEAAAAAVSVSEVRIVVRAWNGDGGDDVTDGGRTTEDGR